MVMDDPAKLEAKRRKHAAYMREYYARKGRKRNKEKDRQYSQRYREEFPEEQRERCRRWRAENKDKLKEYHREHDAEGYRRWRAKKLAEDPEFFKKRWQEARASEEYRRCRLNCHLKRTFGATLEWYEQRLAEQQGVCAICKKPERRSVRGGKVGRLVVDHDHTTGTVRGLLCHTCNMILGNCEDDVQLLWQAIKYLRKYRKRSWPD